jgi:hypothetical protein
MKPKSTFRKVFGSVYVIHGEVALGLFALYGYISTDQKFLLFFVAFSFAGALCGAFTRVIDAVRENNSKI